MTKQDAIEKYGEKRVKEIEIRSEDGSNVIDGVLILVPDRAAYSGYLTFIDKSVERANNNLLNACLLTHKDEIKKDDELFMATVSAIASLIKIGTFSLKN